MSSWVIEWSAQAACRTTDPDELFVQSAAQNRHKAVCTGCPVRTECLADALDNRVEFGVWGGMFFPFDLSHETDRRGDVRPVTRALATLSRAAGPDRRDGV